MSRPLFRPQPVAHLVAVVLALALLADAAGAAPTAEALGRVEAAIRRVAVEATPKTVCVRIDRGGKAAGFGSGAIVSADGLVLTCAHVTEPADHPAGTEAAGEEAHHEAGGNDTESHSQSVD